MRVTCLLLIVTVLLQFALQTQAAQPEISVIYFRPSDRTAPSDIDSDIDTLVKAAQTAYADMMDDAGYGEKTFKFEKNDDDTVKVTHVTGDHDNDHYDAVTNKWNIWDEIKEETGYDPSTNIYIAFMDFESERFNGYCGTGGHWLDGGLGGVVNMAIASGCIDGDHGTAILVHELGHSFGLSHDYRDYPDFNIDLETEDPMVESDCATKWLSAHPYFNDYTTMPTESTAITMSTPSISGSDVTFTFTVTDADGLHQAILLGSTWESYKDFADTHLLDCTSLSSSDTNKTIPFTTSALTSVDTFIGLRVMDALGRSIEKEFTVDLSALPSSSTVDNSDGGSNGGNAVSTTPLSLQGIADNFGQLGPNAADVNGDGVVNIHDLVLAAGALGNAASAPSVSSLNLKDTPTRAEVQEWLREARKVNLKDPGFQRGILMLEQLLVALTPKKTILLPNYPNPFNPETWIPYQLSETAEVAISIYDVSGNVVRSLDLGHQGPGFYHSRSEAAYWDGRNNLNERVASGIYFYHIQAGEFSATRRMLILK